MLGRKFKKIKGHIGHIHTQTIALVSRPIYFSLHTCLHEFTKLNYSTYWHVFHNKIRLFSIVNLYFENSHAFFFFLKHVHIYRQRALPKRVQETQTTETEKHPNFIYLSYWKDHKISFDRLCSSPPNVHRYN